MRTPTLTDIAIVKSYTYCEQYDTNSGRVKEKEGSFYLKQGYIDGFLAGFAHKFETNEGERSD